MNSPRLLVAKHLAYRFLGIAPAAALRFQPTKRPSQPTQKPKPKFAPTKLKEEAAETTPRPPPAAPITKSTLADWTADDDDVNGFYQDEKRQRVSRKKRKKNKSEVVVPQNWDDIYDPARPNSYEEYKHSDEKIREIREWKDRLYAHRMARQQSNESQSDVQPSESFRVVVLYPADHADRFAPPSDYFSAPPSFDPPEETTSSSLHLAGKAPEDASGDDAYARRMRLSGMVPPQSPTTPPLQAVEQSQSPPLPSTGLSKPLSAPSAEISRAPIRYNMPLPPLEVPEIEEEVELRDNPEVPVEDEPRSNRPGQKGFAERLMAKYGWTKGSGLGAKGVGIINPLRVQVEKRKKKPDAEGGGYQGPGGKGKIVGGKKKAGDDEEGLFGPMSEVVVLRGMVDGLDLDAELAQGELMQEIGEECSEKACLSHLLSVHH